MSAAPLGIAACGDDDDDSDSASTTPPAETAAAEPTGDGAPLPTEYTGQFLQIREGTPQAPETVGARLSADDGTTADVSFTLSGPPAAPSGSAKCGGEDFDQATTDDATSAGTLEIVGTGAAELTVDQIITVTDGPPPPVCEERAGTWTGNADGELAGRSGTFTVVSTHSGNTGRSTLTLQEE